MSSETPSRSERDWRFYLEDMLEFSGSVLDYTAGQTQASLAADAMRLDATLRKLSLIGEAATRVPLPVRDLATDIPWRKIIGTRNRLMHAYPSVDLSVLWSVVADDIPALREALKALLAQLPRDPV